MPRMITVHDVEDVDNWLKYKAERAEVVGAIGGMEVVDHVAQDGGRTVAITCLVDDVETVMARMASPSAEMVEAMQRHGVIPPLRMFVER